MRKRPYRMQIRDKCSPELANAMGEDIGSYLRDRTRQDPYFAVMTLAIHGGSVPYSRSQEFVEQLVYNGAERNQDVEFVMRTLLGQPDVPYSPNAVGKKHIYPYGDSRVVTKVTKCYLSICGEDGKKCLDSPARDVLDSCVEQISGAGIKGRALMMQYLGDNTKMPIDRHIVRFLCSIDDENELNCPQEVFGEISQEWKDKIWIKTYLELEPQHAIKQRKPKDIRGWLPTGRERMVYGKRERKTGIFEDVVNKRITQRISDTRSAFINDNYEKLEDFLIRRADACGYDPVKYHNAAWLYNVCASDAGNKAADVREEVFIGKGKVIDCRKILDGDYNDDE